jgi:transcriptional regulator with XRE-family HTH domain
MWRERIIETRKAKGITIKMISERSPSHLPVETITRILNEKTDDPRISTVLALGSSVGLSPWELFAEPTALVAYQGFLTLQAEVDALKAERDALIAENDALKNNVNTLKNTCINLETEMNSVKMKAEIDILKTKLELNEKINSIHDHYNNRNKNN